MDGVDIQEDNNLDDDCEIVFFANKKQITYDQPIDLIEKQVNNELINYPNNVELLLIIGQINLKFKNDSVQALQIFKRVLILDPLNIDSRIEIINLLIQQKQQQNTQYIEILISECMKLDPNYWRVTFMKGMYYLAFFKSQQAIQVLEQGNQIFQNNIWINTLLAQLYSEQQKNNSKVLLQEVTQFKKLNYQVLTGIALTYLNLKEYELAQFYSDKILKINKNSCPAYNIQAQINKFYHKNLEMCFQNSLKCIQIDSNQVQAAYDLYLYYLNKGDEKNKDIYLKKITQLQMTNQQILYQGLQEIYSMHENDLKLSNYYYRKIMRVNPKNLEANLIFLQQGYFEDNEELLQSSINFLNKQKLQNFDDIMDYNTVSQLNFQFL
ncbi:tetratricopeptide repeat protein (macronuclear) [Tetrahymena thermophila SB210]|uniref:Tetratricopeptide repeat protein n=1 Tax=Tetrahymena thermophila (strain SB210) TaxID=312017 RepID=Q24E24_TETTS|nr:tetratricopeptide repeat protein [Tetrahymena thermophila SB210]EAS06077.2 tetratricopeptide repeat protein [Tetrahymena thermophila SB210]|eukprot:XP_001026322.2 tetratricopeptide repeat protein [Tetrahymena thermophila SB210]